MTAATLAPAAGSLTREQLLAAVLRERFARPTRYRLAPVVTVGRFPVDPVAAIEALRESRIWTPEADHAARLLAGVTREPRPAPKEPTR